MLESIFNTSGLVEAGCDEAGRGCLAGSVYAAAVILPPDYRNEALNDSKQLTARRRYRLREEIEHDALAWSVGVVTAREIDRINILYASILAMHRALDGLSLRPGHIIVDGNRFRPYVPLPAPTERPALLQAAPPPEAHGEAVPHTTIVKGDGKYLSIAAASILAKTYRDDYMAALHREFPHYGWDRNAGYPTPAHREGLRRFGPSPYHRLSFNLGLEPTLFDGLEATGDGE